MELEKTIKPTRRIEMTEAQELRIKALELAISLYAGLAEEAKNAVFLDATGDKKDDTADAMVVDFAGTFLKYIG